MPELTDLLAKKTEDTRKVMREAFGKYDPKELAVAWTGGKDSTLLLWHLRGVCAEDDVPVPRCFCIDEGDMFPEIKTILDRLTAEWGLTFDLIHNDDVSKAAGGVLGAEVKVSDLDERNRAEVERLGYEEDTFDYEPESYVGNHLMKTVTMNRYLEDNGIRGVLEGIRWDEQTARKEETHFSHREATEFSPAHDRICPILHFTERDVWDATFALEISHCTLYQQGYRSLGARVSTNKQAEVPAWEQDLENTLERGGRRQDKEDLMEKLRGLGYM